MEGPSRRAVLAGVIVHPRSTFRLLGRTRRLDLAAAVVVSYGALYTVTAAVLAKRRLRPAVKPLLPIPANRYYAWQTLFTIPVAVASWPILAGTSWATLRAAGHPADLRSCAAVLGPAACVPWMVGMWAPETIVAAALPQYWGAPEGTPAIVEWIGSRYLWAVSAWAVGLSAVALRHGTDVDWRRALVAAGLGVGASTGFQMIIVR